VSGWTGEDGPAAARLRQALQALGAAIGAL